MPKKAHNLDDMILSTNALMERIVLEAQGQPFKAAITLKGGEQMWTGDGNLPTFVQRVFAFDLASKLNREIGYGGAWIVMWIHPQAAQGIILQNGVNYSGLRILWIDKDGDPQFTVEADETTDMFMEKGWHYWVEQCEDAHGYWRHQLEVLELSPNQSYKRSKGERTQL
jgi:hypothetical protein